jgi:hypothetical protein
MGNISQEDTRQNGRRPGVLKDITSLIHYNTPIKDTCEWTIGVEPVSRSDPTPPEAISDQSLFLGFSWSRSHVKGVLCRRGLLFPFETCDGY